MRDDLAPLRRPTHTAALASGFVTVIHKKLPGIFLSAIGATPPSSPPAAMRPCLLALLVQLCTGLLQPPRARRHVAPRCCAGETTALYQGLQAVAEAEQRLGQSGAKLAVRRLRRAVQREDYASAEAFKSEVQGLRQRDPLWMLRRDLARAIKTEDYASAAALRTELAALRAARPALLWRDELLVLGRDGQRLMAVGWDSEGSQAARELATAASGSTFFLPTWDPTGERVAVAEVSKNGRGRSRVLILSASDGTLLASFAAPPVFFFFWSQGGAGTGPQLTFLHADPTAKSGAAPLLLGAYNLSDGFPRVVEPGGPLFYSIGPRGRMLLNNGWTNEVSLIPNFTSGAGDDEATLLSSAPTPFRTPLLSPDAAHAIFCEVAPPPAPPPPPAAPADWATMAKQVCLYIARLE